MPSYGKYRENQLRNWTRIEMLLALYDGAIERIARARQLIDNGQQLEAGRLLLRAERIVVELLAGLALDGTELTKNLRKLYLFILDALTKATPHDLEAAERVLRTLREGWERIAPEAIELERKGQIPPVADTRHLELSA